jgi:hypothetical protein
MIGNTAGLLSLPDAIIIDGLEMQMFKFRGEKFQDGVVELVEAFDSCQCADSAPQQSVIL